MDQVGREQRSSTTAVTDRPRRLVKPTRFDPPSLTPLRSERDVLDHHAEQLAAAMAVAREEGMRSARAEVDAAVQFHQSAARRFEQAVVALSSAAAQLEAHDDDSIAGLQQHAVMFGLSLAEELIGRELRSCDDTVIASVERAMSLAPDRGTISLRLHPDDLAVVEAQAAEGGLGGRLELVPDPTVARGGCVAMVGPLRVDAQLDGALARARAALVA